MKRLFALFSLCITMYSLKAQVNSFGANITHLMEHLDFTEVTSGLLADRSVPFVPLDSFDGQELLPTNEMDVNTFGLMYATLYGAALDSNALLPHPDAYMGTATSLGKGDTIPFAILHYDYHRFREDAIEQNLIEVIDSQLYDVANRPESPFLLKKAFGVAPLLDYFDTLDIVFSLSDTLVFGNSDTIHVFEVDLGDGNGYQALAFGQTLIASYEDAGEKELKFRARLNNGDTLYSLAIIVAEGTGSNSRSYSPTPDLTIPINATAEHGSAELQVLLACTNLGLRKPLLYIEGYQPVYTKKKPNQNYGFLTGEDRFGQDIPEGGRIIDILENEGYDLIHLDFTDNGDYVERNAEIVKEAIRAINTMRAAIGSHEKLVVVGASMGAVVGMYALLEMEQAEEDHEVQKFITFDGPFSGGNLPVGLQYAMMHLFSMNTAPPGLPPIDLILFIPQLQDARDAVYNDGYAKQSLIYNLFSIPVAPGYIPFDVSGAEMTTSDYTNFTSTLDGMGKLQHCEFVALSNGAADGTGQGFDPGDILISANGNFAEILEFFADSLFDSDTGEFAPIFQALNLASAPLIQLQFDVQIYAVPNNPSNPQVIYFGETHVDVMTIPVNHSFVLGTVKQTIPYDSAPGGTFYINTSTLPGFVNVHHQNICVVPTVGSIDITTPANANLYLDVSDVEATTSSGLSLADRYDASTDASYNGSVNQEHASLNSTNIPFFVSELTSKDDLPDLPTDTGSGELILDGYTYNYGDAEGLFDPANPNPIRHTPHQLSQSLRVEGNGRLWVNRADRISFTHVTDNPYNTTNSHFDLYIQGRSGCTLGGLDLYIVDGAEMKIGHGAAYNTADVYAMNGASVWVGSGGELIAEDGSQLIIEDGAQVTIEDGGLLQTHYSAKVVVKQGGVLRIESGGMLRPVDYSKILVEPGGILILDDGATVYLWDNNSGQDGACNIHIQGELEVNGEFTFGGPGYFQFDQGHTLTLGSGVAFKLEGGGKGTRILKLNQGTQLDVGGHKIRLADGEVQYASNSAIFLGEGANGSFSSIEFTNLGNPGEADAILAEDQPERIWAEDCTFTEFGYGIRAADVQGFEFAGDLYYFHLRDCEFIDCETAVEVEGTPTVTLEGTDFSVDVTEPLYALSLKTVNNAYVRNCHFSGFTSTLGTVILEDVSDYNMVGGTVSDNAIGIYAFDGENNVDMSSGATIENNELGIKMAGGLSYGVLTMDCSNLLNNDVGVKGNNVFLNIDASGELNSNHFEGTGSDLQFQICYDEIVGAIIGDEIEAKDNFWEGDINYLFNNEYGPGVGNCGYSYGNVDLVMEPDLSMEPSSCGGGMPTEPGEPASPDDGFTGDDRGCLTNNEEVMYDSYWSAYEAYLVESFDVVNIRSLSDSLYYRVASIPDSVNSSYSLKCRQLIHVARSRVNPSWGTESLVAPGNLMPEGSGTLTGSPLKLSPNPAWEKVAVNPGQGRYRLNVFNIYGGLAWTEIVTGTTSISLKGWPEGFYVVEAVDLETKERKAGKLNVE